MTHGSLFSGIGGFDLASEWMGWENKFSCEINPFGRRVLEYYWPNAEHYEDINTTDFTIWRGRIDVLTGGFPCQPFSQAGKRKGTEDDRHLWPRMLEVIQQVQPTWVVGENVYGLTNWDGGLVFEQVCLDLENEGYEVQPVILPAAGVNAPHRRDRVWFVAKNTMRDGWGSKQRKEEPEERGQRDISTGDNERVQANDAEIRNAPNAGIGGVTTNSTSEGRKEWEQDGRRKNTEEIKSRMDDRLERSCNLRNAPNSNSIRRRDKNDWQRQRTAVNVANSKTDLWADFPTQSPVCGRDDELSERLDGITFPKWRNESIKAYGNAIVPQVVYEIFKVIGKIDYLT